MIKKESKKMEINLKNEKYFFKLLLIDKYVKIYEI